MTTSLPNLRLVPRNFHDEATLSTQLTAQPGFGITNTQNTLRDSVWRGAGIATQYVRGVFPDDGRKINFFGLFRHKCHGGTVQLQLYNMPDWTGSVYNSGELETVDLISLGNFDWGTDPLGIVNDPFVDESPFYLFIPPVGVKSYQITFRDTHTQAGAINWEVGRIWLGKYFEVSINPNYGSAIGFSDNSDHSRTRGGSNKTNVGAFWRSLVLDLAWILEEDRATWLDVCRYAMTARDVVVSVFPEEPDDKRFERDHVMNGKFSSLDPLGRQVSYLTKRVVIEEN